MNLQQALRSWPPALWEVHYCTVKGIQGWLPTVPCTDMGLRSQLHCGCVRSAVYWRGCA